MDPSGFAMTVLNFLNCADTHEVQSTVEKIEICSNQEDWEARRAEMKITKGFTAKESVKGHMVCCFINI